MRDRLSYLLIATLLLATAPSAWASSAVRVVAPQQVTEVQEKDAFGYPASVPDPAAIRMLLATLDFAALESLFAGYQRAFEADFRAERWLTVAFVAFRQSSSTHGRAFQAWRESHPDSWAAPLAQAYFSIGEAWRARGMASAARTSPDQMRGFHALLERAHALVVEALEREPRAVAAYEALLIIAKGTSDRELAAFALDRALEVHPELYGVRDAYAALLVRRWGGSYEELDRFAADAQPRAFENPRLLTLQGLSAWDRGRDLKKVGPSATVLAELDRAVSLGAHPKILLSRARHHHRTEQRELALRDFELGLALDPLDPDLLRGRANVTFELERFDEASAQLDAARRLHPRDTEIREAWEWQRQTRPYYERPLPVRYALYYLAKVRDHAVLSGLTLLGSYFLWRWHRRKRDAGRPSSDRTSATPVASPLGSAKPPLEDVHPGHPLWRRIWTYYVVVVALLWMGDYLWTWPRLPDVERYLGLPIMLLAFTGGLGFTLQRRWLRAEIWRLSAFLLPCWLGYVWAELRNWGLKEWFAWGYTLVELAPLWAALIAYGFRSEHLWRNEALPRAAVADSGCTVSSSPPGSSFVR